MHNPQQPKDYPEPADEFHAELESSSWPHHRAIAILMALFFAAQTSLLLIIWRLVAGCE